MENTQIRAIKFHKFPTEHTEQGKLMDERVDTANKRDGKHAVIFGSTGLVGTELLTLLLEDDYWDHITCIGRKNPVGFAKNERLTTVETNLFAPGLYQAHLRADTVFICLGTTRKKAGSKEAFWRIDVDLPIMIAQACAKAGVKKIVAISSAGASKDARFLYLKAKGTMEAGLYESGIPQVAMVRPSQLLGDRQERRVAEGIAIFLLRNLSWLLRHRFFAKYRAIHVRTVAAAMNNLSQKEQMPSLVENAALFEYEPEAHDG